MVSPLGQSHFMEGDVEGKYQQCHAECEQGRGCKNLELEREHGEDGSTRPVRPFPPQWRAPGLHLLCCLPPPCLLRPQPQAPAHPHPPFSLSPSPTLPLSVPPHFLPCSLSLSLSNGHMSENIMCTADLHNSRSIKLNLHNSFDYTCY